MLVTSKVPPQCNSIKTMNTPNWQKHSKKDKKTKGTCKGVIKARKQALKCLKLKLTSQ